jgi:hypothetical protein
VTAEPQPPTEAPVTPGDAITVAFVHSSDVAYSWHHSMMQMVGFDFANQARILRGGWIAMRCGAAGLVEARNQAVAEFLSSHDSEWLLWLDTDMGFPADLAERLLEAADPAERPIVGALCFSQRETEPDGMGGWRCRAVPTVFDWTKLESGAEGFLIRWDYAPDTVVRCNGTGSAAVLVHRSVFSRVAAKFGPKWYGMVPNPSTGDLIGEDLSFCLRAAALGIPVHVHTGVPTSHMKRLWLGEPDYHAEQLADVPSLLRGTSRGTLFGKPLELAASWPDGTPDGMDAEQLAKVADVMDAERGRLADAAEREPKAEPAESPA